jgi:predicted ribosome quality control (RQC) complex YloA/Tae2 family protein
MQPFDALTLKAILQELQPLVTKTRIDRIYQIGRDEIILSLRSKTGITNLLISAHQAYGRLSITKKPNPSKQHNQPNFCLLLRKHLTGAQLIQLSGLVGERIADLTFACRDEVGTESTKILSAEIMGKHSNLIAWEKETKKIIAVSHVVSESMSRQRQISPGLTYTRPPVNDKTNIFSLDKETFFHKFEQLNNLKSSENISLEEWLLKHFSGLGRHLAEEIVSATSTTDSLAQNIWQSINTIANSTEYKPAMSLDLIDYTVLSLSSKTKENDYQSYSSVNDMVDEYYLRLQERTQIQQIKDRIKAELNVQKNKLELNRDASIKQLATTENLDSYKHFGDFILANVNQIHPGQESFVCDDFYNTNNKISIELNPNLNASQNAQHYYRLFAKARTRKKMAEENIAYANEKLETIQSHLNELTAANSLSEIERMQGYVLGYKQKQISAHKAQEQSKSKSKTKASPLLNIKSSDGFVIYVGRNRNENDYLISKTAKPFDIWLHVKGQQGSHALIKLPNKEDPPLTTIKEAAELVARFSKTGLGSKITVIYTYAKHVKKIGKDKPGQVIYTNEKTIVVDTAKTITKVLQKLFK